MLRPFRSILPKVHKTAYIDESAQVIGNVEIGQESSVWMNVVIRGDVNAIRIGDRTNIQDGTVVHADPGYPTLVGDEVTIGHRCVIHGCTIGSGSLVGMSSTIMNGAAIGEGCLIGAGTLITEGKQIPAGSLVMGSPGKVVRPSRSTVTPPTM